MNNNTPINIRIKFKKVGNLQYISHLDLVRTMHKIVTRSHLPLWYTQGFNPKPKMVFAAPLSIGTESLAEFMDLRLSEHVDPETVVRALNVNMTDELVALEAYYPTAPLTDLAWLAYTITVDTVGASDMLAETCNKAFTTDKMIITKKNSTDEIDIKPLIKEAVTTFSDGKLVIYCILSASPSSFLNPEYVVKYLRSACSILSDPNLMNESYGILRTHAFKCDMTEFR